MNIGIFGGTFNPVHIGHVRAAEAFASEMKLDRLYILPNFLPPLKERESAPACDRLNMLKIAFNNNKNFIVNDFELKNGGTSYTYKTIEHFRNLFPKARLFLLIGDDNLLIFRKWKNYKYILENCILCVAMRSNAEISKTKESLEKEYKAEINVLNFKPTVISSTQLRENINSNYLQKGVFDYIYKKGLYK